MRKVIHKWKAFKTAANLPSKFTQRSEKLKKNPRAVSEILQGTVVMLNVKVREKTIKNRPNKYGLFNREKKLKVTLWFRFGKLHLNKTLKG